MKKAADIFEKMREYFHSEAFREACRVNAKDFSRCRILTHQVIFLLILNLLKRSIAIEFINFSQYLDIPQVSCAAISKARAKISPQAFVIVNDILIKEFYTSQLVRTFYGFIPLAIDGSTFELPIGSPSIENKYGYASNQTDKKVPMARASYLYDLENGLTLDARLSSYKTDERSLALLHLEKMLSIMPEEVKKKMLLIMDRGYPSADLLFYLLKFNIPFVMRSSKKFIKEIEKTVARGKKDTICEINIQKTGPIAKAFKKYFPDKKKIQVRVLLIRLQSGEIEVLISSLLDRTKYPYNIFSELYFKRWGIEENYKFHKVSQEIEKISGLSCHAVEQDFHALILATNARALMALEAQKEINHVQRKYDYQINKVVSMAVLKEEFVYALIDKEVDLEEMCTKFKTIIKRHLVPIRPGRMYERKCKHSRRKYSMNRRR